MSNTLRYQLTHFNIHEFLSQYWQKRPGIFRGVFENFEDPIDEHELAGLAQDAEIDSRIISQQRSAVKTDASWHVNFGPFETFDEYCKGAWSLLVKGINFYDPDVQALFDAFHFLPAWRKEDVMVSFSNAGAGVGPHLDQYDVFIIQGKGERRWQVGPIGDYQSIHPDPNLAQIVGFEPILDEVLAPGDMIYIPPQHPHNGVALTHCLNYSIGFRSPSQQDLLTALAHYAHESESFTERYRDPPILVSKDMYGLEESEIENVQSLLHKVIDSEQFKGWFGAFASEHHAMAIPELEIAECEAITVDELVSAINDGASLVRAPWVKPLYLADAAEARSPNTPTVTESSPGGHEQNTETDFCFFVAGKQYAVPMSARDEALGFLSASRWAGDIQGLAPELARIIVNLITIEQWSVEA